MVVIKRQETADNRDIVAAVVDSENATLKRFMKMGDSVLLIPENDKKEETICREALKNKLF